MNPLKQLQQETEEMFDRNFILPDKTIAYHGIDSEDGVSKINLKSFIHSRESIAYKAGLEEVREKVKEMEVDCEEPGYEMPQDPGLAADQALNYAVREVLTLIDEELKQ